MRLPAAPAPCATAPRADADMRVIRWP